LLIDSSILIDHPRGRTEAKSFLLSLRASGNLQTSAVAAAEVLIGARDLREQREIDRLLADFHIEHIDPADCAVSLDLLRRHRLSAGVGWLDCLIAATAMRLGVPVATLNERHFSTIAGLTVNRPY
jgi:predicted nucleic acid-binding protein